MFPWINQGEVLHYQKAKQKLFFCLRALTKTPSMKKGSKSDVTQRKGPSLLTKRMWFYLSA